MSKTRSVNPPLSKPDGAALARRYANGEPLPALVAEYRIWTATAKRAIRRGLVPLRPEDTAPRLCRVCRAPVPSLTKRLLCAAHVRSFCSKCDAALPAGRVDRSCPACEAAHKQRYYAKRRRRCTTCEEPVTGRASQCAGCLRAEYVLQRLVLARVARPCRVCETVMPKGRRVPWCLLCWKKRERRRRRERQKRGEHRCLMCGEALPLSRSSYCGGCGAMIQKWRAAYHQGNPVARQLGTVRQTRRWQARSAA